MSCANLLVCKLFSGGVSEYSSNNLFSKILKVIYPKNTKYNYKNFCGIHKINKSYELQNHYEILKASCLFKSAEQKSNRAKERKHIIEQTSERERKREVKTHPVEKLHMTKSV